MPIEGVDGLAVDGPGSALYGVYAGGAFRQAGSIDAKGVARWAQHRWHALGAGLGPIAGSAARAIAPFDDDGPGPAAAAAYVGGAFQSAGGIVLEALAVWNGGSWSLPPIPLEGTPTARPIVWDLLVRDDEVSERSVLYIGGRLSRAGSTVANNIVRWDGVTATALDYGTDGTVQAMSVFDDDGPGPNKPYLYVGGTFHNVGSANPVRTRGLARWDGRRWSSAPGWPGASVWALAVFDDDGPGPNKPSLFVGGNLLSVGGQPAGGIARWDGQEWTPLPPLAGIGGPSVHALAAFDEDGEGPNPGGLYVGGYFSYAGGLWSPGLARWGCPLPDRCYPDCDLSTGRGVLDIFDFLCFQNRFLAQDPWACECDVSTGYNVCDLLDFLCFQTAFVAGCP